MNSSGCTTGVANEDDEPEGWIPTYVGMTKAEMKLKQPAVYILASQRKGTLYTGVTNDLSRRIWEHKNDLIEGFTRKYSVHQLVYYELHNDMVTAITREKQIKKWKRSWKIELIERDNPDWRDRWDELI